ncbi:MAG TPA: hypothetical protein VGM83_11705 [Devosiaceae bacterium]
MHKPLLGALALTLIALPFPAFATGYISAYTDLDTAQCSVLVADDFSTSYACPGYKGMPVWVTEGDLRFMVSFGFGAPDAKAATQTPPPFNTIGSKIEWRLSNEAGGFAPIAAITRYKLDADEAQGRPEGEVLVVTKISPEATCHIAYIDARANPNANEMARQVADDKAKSFDCANEPEEVGTFKAW